MLQTPVDIEKAKPRAEFYWPKGDSHDAAPKLGISKTDAVLGF